ncbi:Tn3 family transposase, partial [Herbaspirillum huttiense]|uniref:Tn3 family transposase n=1 Tax=Herbaspirillum huttiense TaxID=863372 RepID=UPI00382D1410
LRQTTTAGSPAILRCRHNLNQIASANLGAVHAEQTEKLIGQFREVLSVLNEDGSGDQKIARVDESLHGEYEKWINQCDEHMAFAGNNYFPFMLNGYAPKRSLFFKCLEALSLRSSSQDSSLLDAIEFLQQYRTSHREQLPCQESGINELDLEWMPDKWRMLVFGKRKDDSEPHFHRKYFELAVFSSVTDELKSGDLYVEHSGEYDDYRSHLISWEQYEAEVGAYGEMVGLPVEPEKFVEELKAQLRSLAKLVDERFPENGYVDLDQSGVVIKRPERSKPPEGIETIDRAITAEMSEASILDILTETEQWLDLHRFFGPLSGFEAKVDDPRKRFITTLFCYGCNLGPVQTARSVKGLSRKQVAWLNLKHVTEQRLDKAIVKVINAYNRFSLPRYWGTGKSASADGTKWNVFEQNLLSEYHIRYGGYGGIGYYHVSDKYIALFSHFIPCGVYEAVYILDGLIYNQSDIQPDTLHGDTQAQSTPVFGLAHLLGINLMPRIRNIKDLVFFRADRLDHYEHIGSLFRNNIDWELIARHMKDMMRVVLSIKAGKIAPSTILRRLGTASRKNRLYYAFRELGRAVRTMFLLKYINDAELRKTINAATNKSEEFNDFVKWLFFGGDGIIAENIRHEQRKVIKYNQLVANMVILHNVHTMSKILKRLQAKGYTLTEEILRGMAPYRRAHINRFGEYPLDLDRAAEPLNYKINFSF